MPLTFTLGGARGPAVLAADPPGSRPIAGASGAPASDVAGTITAGRSGLAYDAASGQYTYTWKTDEAWAGTCRDFVFRPADGTTRTALFRFR